MLVFETTKIKNINYSSTNNMLVREKLTDLNTLKQNKFNINYLTNESMKNIKNRVVPLTSYVININLSNSNSSILITNRTGKIKAYCTSGILGFSKTQKYTIIALLKKVLYNYNFLDNKTAIIIFKGLKKYHKLIISRLKKKVHIKAIIYNNLLPHNGCRPKKIRRI